MIDRVVVLVVVAMVVSMGVTQLNETLCIHDFYSELLLICLLSVVFGIVVVLLRDAVVPRQ
jgi:hypothetical protein